MRITVDPARHGLVRVAVTVTGEAPTAVTLAATLPSQDLGPQPIALSADVGGGGCSERRADVVGGAERVAVALEDEPGDARQQQLVDA